MEDFIGYLLITLLVLVICFLVTREFWCWYWKINARLHTQEKTNELLQDIYDALVQGNTVSAVTAGQIIGMNQNGAEPAAPAFNSGDIPEL